MITDQAILILSLLQQAYVTWKQVRKWVSVLTEADSHPGKLRGECVPGVPLAKPAFPLAFCTSQENILFFVCLRQRERERSESQCGGDSGSPGKEEQSSTEGLGLLHPWWQPEQGRRICLFRPRLQIYLCHFGLKKINCASAHNYIITLYSNISRLQNDS